jgi:hypothetical protein
MCNKAWFKQELDKPLFDWWHLDVNCEKHYKLWKQSYSKVCIGSEVIESRECK